MLGQVQINNLNLMQGPITEIERHLLFVGRGSGTNEDTVQMVNTDTDLDLVLGASASTLKEELHSAMVNAGQNWIATVVPLATATSWEDGVYLAMKAGSVEGVVVTDPIDSAADVSAAQELAAEIMATYRRPLFFMLTAAAIDAESETWSDYAARVKNLVADVAAPNVMVAPLLVGEIAGRLCNRAVTVADTPMRVKTGALIGVDSLPVDSTGREMDMAVLTDLANARLSVPQTYPEFPGIYWGDGALLDAPGGDYQVIENLRVIHKAMRRVYPIAVGLIGDRQLNSTPASIEATKSILLKPLLEMARATDINGVTFVGEIEPPSDGDIQITWVNKYEVIIHMQVGPYDCPKKIGVNIALDLRNPI